MRRMFTRSFLLLKAKEYSPWVPTINKIKWQNSDKFKKPWKRKYAFQIMWERFLCKNQRIFFSENIFFWGNFFFNSHKRDIMLRDICTYLSDIMTQLSLNEWKHSTVEQHSYPACWIKGQDHLKHHRGYRVNYTVRWGEERNTIRGVKKMSSNERNKNANWINWINYIK